MVNLVFLVRCIQLNHVEYTALFITHLVYADISRKPCCGGEREKYMFYFKVLSTYSTLEKNCSRFVYNFQKIREYKNKGYTLCSS